MSCRARPRASRMFLHDIAREQYMLLATRSRTHIDAPAWLVHLHVGVPEEDKREKAKRLSRSTGGCMGAVHACHGSRTPIHSRMQKRMHAKQRRRCPLSDGEWKAARTRFNWPLSSPCACMRETGLALCKKMEPVKCVLITASCP